ncbi:hypothetical protein J2W42_005300 [Rhizobium tibeticum]|nr:hypothetical protein [Rhizobium tibeticum]
MSRNSMISMLVDCHSSSSSGASSRAMRRHLSHRSAGCAARARGTPTWMAINDWLDDICDDVVLAHPLKVKAIADAKFKTDKIDAAVLEHLPGAALVVPIHLRERGRVQGERGCGPSTDSPFGFGAGVSLLVSRHGCLRSRDSSGASSWSGRRRKGRAGGAKGGQARRSQPRRGRCGPQGDHHAAMASTSCTAPGTAWASTATSRPI